MKKLLISLFVITTTFFIFSSYYWYQSNYFRLIFFNVGQGDSILIVSPNGHTILIDGGPDASVLRGLGQVLPMWLRQIDLVILTHAHDDHVAGLIEVLIRYKVKKIIINHTNYNSASLKAWQEQIINSESEVIMAKEGMIFDFNDKCFIEILSAFKGDASMENDYSIVSLFSCLGKKILLTGDAGIKVENNLLLNIANLKSDILKISHHGSNTANSKIFLQAVKPRLAIVSVGKTNTFGHPNQAVLDTLTTLVIKVLRTDLDGSLYFLANNKTIILKK